MGSESKHKKRGRKRKHVEGSADSGSDSEGSRTDDSGSGESDHKRSSKHAKHSKEKKRHGNKKKSSSSKEERRKLKEAKKFIKEHIRGVQGGVGKSSKPLPMLPVSDDFQITPITADEYFQRNIEFSKWLKEQKGLLFNEMSSEETHSAFGEFVDAWNGRRLSQDYYQGGMTVTTVARTSYNWGIRPETSAADRIEREREEQAAARQMAKHERKAWRQEQKDILDEMLPKATGRDATLEKKALRRDEMRERERGGSPEMTRLIGGGDIMGGDDSFAAAKAEAKAREQRWAHKRSLRQTARDEELNARAAAARANEDARIAMLKDLVEKGPIRIPKRQ